MYFCDGNALLFLSFGKFIEQPMNTNHQPFISSYISKQINLNFKSMTNTFHLFQLLYQNISHSHLNQFLVHSYCSSSLISHLRPIHPSTHPLHLLQSLSLLYLLFFIPAILSRKSSPFIFFGNPQISFIIFILYCQQYLLCPRSKVVINSAMVRAS